MVRHSDPISLWKTLISSSDLELSKISRHSAIILNLSQIRHCPKILLASGPVTTADNVMISAHSSAGAVVLLPQTKSERRREKLKHLKQRIRHLYSSQPSSPPDGASLQHPRAGRNSICFRSPSHGRCIRTPQPQTRRRPRATISHHVCLSHFGEIW